jgi:phosphohistidine phosphatase
MDLLFLRHGIAEEQSESGADFDRRLTAEGRERCLEAAAGFQALDPRPTHVWSSPLIRAWQTAELVVPKPAYALRDELANASPADLLDALRALPADAVVVLVGHEPQLSSTIEHLLGAQHGLVSMKKAALARVSVDLAAWPGRAAVLVWLLAPAQLRALGR